MSHPNKAVTSTDLNGNQYEVAVTDLTWRPAAYGVVTRGPQILLVKADSKYHLPGGGIELGEFPEAAVLREVTEETGIRTTHARLIGALSTFFAFDAYGSTTTRHVQSLLLYYLCDPVNGELSSSGLEDYEKQMGVTAEWVNIDQLDQIIIGTSVDWRPLVKEALSK
jgi:8-oxo-dGTP diphosphatase